MQPTLTRIRPFAALTVLLALCAPLSPSTAQRLPETSRWAVRRSAASDVTASGAHSDSVAGQQRYNATTAGLAAAVLGSGGALYGAFVGWTAGVCVCEANDDTPDTGLFAWAECLGGNDGMIYGSLIGSTVIVAVTADQFGWATRCEPGSVRRRAVVGTLLGALPSVLYVATNREVLRPANVELEGNSATRVIGFGTPLLQAVTATVAVARCHRR